MDGSNFGDTGREKGERQRVDGEVLDDFEAISTDEEERSDKKGAYFEGRELS